MVCASTSKRLDQNIFLFLVAVVIFGELDSEELECLYAYRSVVSSRHLKNYSYFYELVIKFGPGTLFGVSHKKQLYFYEPMVTCS